MTVVILVFFGGLFTNPRHNKDTDVFCNIIFAINL